MNAYGPFEPGIPDTERRARTRALHALACVYARKNEPLRAALTAAETDPGQLDVARALIDALPSKTRRHLLASYMTLSSAIRRSLIKPA